MWATLWIHEENKIKPTFYSWELGAKLIAGVDLAREDVVLPPRQPRAAKCRSRSARADLSSFWRSQVNVPLRAAVTVENVMQIGWCDFSSGAWSEGKRQK